jgi:ABC-2 type transport system ATP-binding protein
VSSHNLSHTVEISTRIALMENGVIIKDLSNDEDGSAKVQLENYFETEA